MKLLRVGSENNEKPAIIDGDNVYRDLSSIINDFSPDTINFTTLEKIRKVDIKKLPELPGNSRVGPCVKRPQKFIGIGLN